MARFLPVAVMQAAPIDAATAIDVFAARLRDVMATHPGTRMVLHPELHLCGTTADGGDETVQLQAVAEPLHGTRGTALAELAAELGIWLLPGSVCERGEAGELYNTSMAYAPDGSLVASYRKIFPWLPFEPYESGDRFVVFDMPDIGRVGLAICYDLWFPEVARNLAWLGAEMIVYPTQTTTCDRHQEVIMAQATAIQNQVFVVVPNVASPKGTGRSLIVDPEGLVRTEAPDASPAILTDVLDFDAVTRVRDYGTCGLNRMWSQMASLPGPIQLPAYAGAIDPARWADASNSGE